MVTIQPVNFYVPPEIQLGLATGDLIRFGGVVRDGGGHLVKHLREVPLDSNGEEAALRLAARLRNPWVVAGLGLGAAAIASIATLAVRKTRKAQEIVARYNASFAAYLESVQDGTLDEDAIDRLIADLDAVNASSEEGKITLGFSPEQSQTLVRLVADFTRELAKANSVELDRDQTNESESEHDPVIYLRRHLETQKRIFTEAA